MISAILKLFGILALMGLSFGAGVVYQKNQTIKKVVDQKVQEVSNKAMEKLK
jgi:hypothetical protein